MITGVGKYSQWGRIKANLVTSNVNTPLQDKLQAMTETIGKVGAAFAIVTFTVLLAYALAANNATAATQAAGCVHAFIIAVTVLVVAIPGERAMLVILITSA
jgi:Ca2+-transporting ATPase